MSEGEVKFGAFVIVTGFISYAIYTNWAQIAPYFWGVVVAACVIIATGIFFLIIYPKLREKRLISKSKHSGPMEVSLRTEHRGSKWRLHIDAKLSQEDINALKRSGMEDYLLFEYPHPKLEGVNHQYCGITLLYVRKVDFPSMGDMEVAKQQLLQRLYTMRNVMERSKEQEAQEIRGTTEERYEI